MELTTKKHILFLPKWYPSKNNTTNGIFIKKHAETVVKNEHITVTVLHTVIDSQVEKSTEDIQLSSSPKTLQKLIEDKAKLFNFFETLGSQFSLRKNIKRPIDLVHVHVLGRQAILALYLKWFKGIPFVVTEHWTAFSKENQKISGLKKWFYKLVCKNASEITTVSKHLGESMKTLGLLKNYSTISNVVDTDMFTIAESFSNDATHIVHVSNLGNAHKQTDKILASISALIEKGKAIHLHIIGDGPDGAGQRKLAGNLNIEEFVTFYGNLPPQEVATIMKQCHLKVLFSQYENQPVSLLEALSCGLPVVSSDVGGISEFVNNSNGMLIDKDDPMALKEALRTMIKDHGRYNKLTIREAILKICSQDVVQEEFNLLYNKALTK